MYIYTTIYIYIYICMYVCMYVCIYVCMYVYVYIHTYIHLSLSLYIYIYMYVRISLAAWTVHVDVHDSNDTSSGYATRVRITWHALYSRFILSALVVLLLLHSRCIHVYSPRGRSLDSRVETLPAFGGKPSCCQRSAEACTQRWGARICFSRTARHVHRR